MSIKISGKVWKAFYNDDTAWSNGSYHDDESNILVDGGSPTTLLEDVDDWSIVEVKSGLYYVGGDPNKVIDLVIFLETWLAGNNKEVLGKERFTIEIDWENVFFVKHLIAKLGGRIIL